MNNITKHESNSVLYLIPQVLFLGLGFTQILTNTGTSFYFSIILGTIIGLIINFILTKLPEKSNKFFVLTNIIFLTIGSISLSKTITTLYLDKISSYLVLIPVFILLYYLTTKKENTIFKISSIIIIINILLFTIGALSLIPLINFKNFMPLNNPLTSSVFTSALKYGLLTSLPYTIIPNFKKRYNYKSYLLSSLTLFVVFTLIIGVLGFNIVSIFKYPEYMILKRISIFGFIENIQNIIFIIWINILFILMAFSSINIVEKANKNILLLIFLFILTLNFIIKPTYLFYIISDDINYVLLTIIIIFALSKIFHKKKR